MKRHFAGKLIIPEKTVLDWLGYSGGKLHFFGRAEDYLATVAVIEHKDMPEVESGEMLPLIPDGPRGIYWNTKDHILMRMYPGKKLHHHIADMFRLLRDYWSLVALQRKYNRKEKSK